MANPALRIEAKISDKDIMLLREKLAHIPDGFNKASVMALNKAVVGIKSDMKKEVIDAYAIKAKIALDSMSIKKAGKSDLTAYVLSKGTTIPLTDFKYSARYTLDKKPHLVYLPKHDAYRWIKQRNWVIISEVIKGKSNKFKNAFLATMKGKLHMGIFKNDHIQPLWGPSVPVMLQQQKVMPKIQKQADDRLSLEISRAIDKMVAEFDK